MKKSYPWILIIVVIMCVGASISMFMVLIDKTHVKLENEINNLKSQKFDIEIKEVKNEITDATVDTFEIKNSQIHLVGKLDGGESKIIYDLKVKNNGTFASQLYSILNENDDISISLLKDGKKVRTGTILKPNEEIDVEMVVQNKQDEEVDFDVLTQLIFSQVK